MADEQSDEGQEPEQTPPEPVKDWQAEADKWKNLARKHEQTARANMTAAQRLAQLEESQKTEAQKLTERAETAERTATSAQRDLLRYRVATTKAVPADLVDRLRGESEDELSADADALLDRLRPANQVPSFNGGPRTTPPANDMNALIRRSAGH